MSDADASLSSLTVLGGPLDGASLVLDQAKDEILIGSDPGCGFHLDLPGVSPIHARLWIDMSGVTVHDTHSPRGIFVNDDAVSDEAKLKDGDVLWLGAPGDPDSVMVRCRIVAAAPPPPPMPPDEAGEFIVADGPSVEALPDAAAPSDASGFIIDEPPSEEIAPILVSPASDPFVYEAEEPGGPPLPVPLPPAAPAEEAAAEPEMFVFEEPGAAPASDPGPPVEEFVVDEAAAAAPLPPFAPEEPPPPIMASPPPPPPPAPAPAVASPPAVQAPKPAPPQPAAPPPKPAAPAPKPASAPAAPVEAPVAAVPAKPAPALPAPPSPEPAAPAPAAKPAAPVPAPAAKPAPRPAAAKAGPGAARYAPIAIGALLLLGGGGYAALHVMSAPQLYGVSPGRVRIGEAVTLSGKNFSSNAAENAVVFGDQPARVTQASATQLEVEVPVVTTTPGKDVSVPVVVRVKGRDSKPATVAVYQAPRIHGVSPDVGMPGDEVLLAGTGFSGGMKVLFGKAPAEVLESTAASIRVRVPALEEPPGTAVNVTVTAGADASNAAPFLVGRLPLVKSIEPQSAASGDVVTISGRGFHAEAAQNDVRIGGVRALVVTASDGELKVALPWQASGGPVPVELRVPGSANVAQATLTLAPPADPVAFRFAAEPVEGAPELSAVGSALGAAFVLAPSGGKSAAERAVEAARKLNEAAGPIRASRDAELVARGLDASPSIVLAGKSDALLQVTPEDAAAYTDRQGGKGNPVSVARLAVWWEALARDLVLMLVRGEKPQRAAALAASDSRPLAELFAAAQKAGGFGIPRQVLSGAKPPLLAAIRGLSLRVPASVPQPAGAPTTAAGGPTLPPIPMDRTWSGSELDSGVRKYISIVFKGRGGTFAYEGGVSVSTPLTSVEPGKAGVKFLVETGGRKRHYDGKWDGSKLAGTISSDPSGKGDLGSFELQAR